MIIYLTIHLLNLPLVSSWLCIWAWVVSVYQIFGWNFCLASSSADCILFLFSHGKKDKLFHQEGNHIHTRTQTCTQTCNQTLIKKVDWAWVFTYLLNTLIDVSAGDISLEVIAGLNRSTQKCLEAPNFWRRCVKKKWPYLVNYLIINQWQAFYLATLGMVPNILKGPLELLQAVKANWPSLFALVRVPPQDDWHLHLPRPVCWLALCNAMASLPRELAAKLATPVATRELQVRGVISYEGCTDDSFFCCGCDGGRTFQCDFGDV